MPILNSRHPKLLLFLDSHDDKDCFENSVRHRVLMIKKTVICFLSIRLKHCCKQKNQLGYVNRFKRKSSKLTYYKSQQKGILLHVRIIFIVLQTIIVVLQFYCTYIHKDTIHTSIFSFILCMIAVCQFIEKGQQNNNFGTYTIFITANLYLKPFPYSIMEVNMQIKWSRIIFQRYSWCCHWFYHHFLKCNKDRWLLPQISNTMYRA